MPRSKGGALLQAVTALQKRHLHLCSSGLLRPARSTNQCLAKHAVRTPPRIMQSMAVCQIHMASKSLHAVML